MGGRVEGCSWAEGEIELEGMRFGRGGGECGIERGWVYLWDWYI